MKVFGWHDFTVNPATNRRVQSRCIAATPTKKAAAILAGYPSGRAPEALDLGDTENDVELAVALAEPGVIFWRGITEWHANYQRLEK